MTDPTTSPPSPTESRPPGFPFLTALVSLLALFVFAGLVLLAYYSPNYLREEQPEPPPDPATKLEEIRARNQAVLDAVPGSGAKRSVGAATAELLSRLKTPQDRLPFPIPEPPAGGKP